MRETSSLLVGMIALVSTLCCTHQTATIRNNHMATEEQKGPATKIKRQWEEECKKLDPMKLTKEYPGKKLDIMAKLLKAAPAPEVKNELERVRNEPNDYYQMSDYDQYLLQAFFGIYASKRNRDGLIYLLSAKCPRFIATSPVELEIASLEITEPFLILFDSYAAASTDGERRFLLSILRDSLRDLSQKYANDTDFLKESRDWYTQSVSKITINPYYHPAGRAEQRDLFVPKR